MALEVIGPGTQFKIGATPLAECRDIEGPNEECDDIDVSSNIDAVVTAGKNFHRRFKPGMTDAGEVKVTVVWTKANYAVARTALRLQQAFSIVASDGSILLLGNESYIKSVSPQYPWEKECVYDLVVKVSGEPTFTPGTLLLVREGDEGDRAEPR